MGFTFLQVLTGCRPFSDLNKSVTVICKVMDGNRPERPPSGFTDPLWDLLAETWLDQHFDEPQKRPPVSTVLDRLRESVGDWDKSITPVIPKQWEESGEYAMSPSKCRDLLMSLLQTQTSKEMIVSQRLSVSDHHI